VWADVGSVIMLINSNDDHLSTFVAFVVN